MKSLVCRRFFLAFIGAGSMSSAALLAQPLAPIISAPVESTFQRVLAVPAVKAALAAIEADDERTLRDQIELTEIPSPPFKEAVRVAEYAKRLRALGFADASVDKEGNVIAVRKGNGKGPLLVVSAHLETPSEPKTTYTVGTVKGGTSVNAIAADAEIGLDMRSNSATELAKLEVKMLAIARAAADEENARWKQPGRVKVEIRLVGDRPAGMQPKDSLITQVGVRSAQALGVKDFFIGASSTDSNTPIALGFPAVTLGGGGIGGGSHAPLEWFSPLNAWRGPQNTLLAILALVGVEGVSEPMLPKRAR